MRKIAAIALCLSLVIGAAGCAPKTPRLDVTEGSYDQEFNAKVVNLDEGESAYYTLDGSEPTQDSILYTQDGIPVTEGENQVKVIKFNQDGKSSDVLTALLTITPQKPQLATPDGVYYAEFAAKIVDLREGYKAYYTLDGSEPDESSNLYTEAGIPLTEGENQVKVIKYDESGNSSDIHTSILTIVPSYEPDYSNYFTQLHKQGNTIYYVQYVGPDSFFHYSKLCSYNLDDGSSDVVLDLDISSFIIREGMIYYQYIDQESEEAFAGGIFSSDMHGDNCQQLLKINPDCSTNKLMIDGWLYYDYWSSDEEPKLLYRINLNTLVAEKVSETEVLFLEFVVNRDIFYRDNWFNLYRYNMDTTQNTLISSQVFNLKEFGDGYLYYYTSEPAPCVYRIRPNGTGKELIPGPDSSDFVVVGDRVYYANSSGLNSIGINGADHRVVCSNIPRNLHYYQGKLFFNGNGWGSAGHYLYSLDLDTDEITLLMESKGDPKGYFVDGEVYFIYQNVAKGDAGLYHLTETGLEKLAGQEE